MCLLAIPSVPSRVDDKGLRDNVLVHPSYVSTA